MNAVHRGQRHNVGLSSGMVATVSVPISGMYTPIEAQESCA
jgi:hypothetical protein